MLNTCGYHLKRPVELNNVLGFFPIRGELTLQILFSEDLEMILIWCLCIKLTTGKYFVNSAFSYLLSINKKQSKHLPLIFMPQAKQGEWKRFLELQIEPLNCRNLLISFMKSIAELLLSLPVVIQITVPS